MVWDLKCRLHHVFSGVLKPYSTIFNFDIVDVLEVFIETFLIRVTQRLSLVEKELLSLPEHTFTPGFLLGFVLLCCPFVLFLFGNCIV